MEAAASFIAGFAFFLVGLKLFASNLNQLTSKRFREFITRFTDSGFLAGVSGIILSLFTAGNIVLTPCVAAGLVQVKAMTLRRSIQLVIWSRVGACFYIYLAGFSIKVFILFLIGITGITFAINKPKKLVTLAASMFSLGLVLFGIQEIKGSTKVLTHFDWFSDIIAYTALYPEIALLAGCLFLICTQSLFGSLVVALSFLDSGVFNTQQALLFMYGVYLGEAILKLFYQAAFKGAFRQMMGLIPLMYFCVFAVAMVTHYTEAWLGIPLLEGPLGAISVDPKQHLAHVNLAITLITAICLTVALPWIESVIAKLGDEEEEEEAAIKDVDIPKQILDDPHMTMALIHMEERRLAEHLPEYMEQLRSGRSLSNPLGIDQLHQALSKNFNVINDTYSKLLNISSYDDKVSQRMLLGIELKNFLISLEDNLYEFSVTLDKLRNAVDDSEMNEKILGFVEAIDVLVLTMIDVLSSQEAFYSEVLQGITAERSDFMKEVTEQYSRKLPLEQQADLVKLINLFESSVWVVKKISDLLVTTVDS